MKHFKLKWLLVLGILLVVIPVNTYALEWDNVKSYDSDTKTVTVENLFGLGKDIAYVKLNSPLEVHTFAGYQKVAEFEVSSSTDYSDFLKKMEFYDLNDDEKEIKRNYDLKKKVNYSEEVNDYESICKTKEVCYNSTNSTNGTSCYNESYDCIQKLTGSHNETKYNWISIDTGWDLFDIKKGETTIGVFTTVRDGDYVEWVPSLFGVKVDEWAVWTADLNTGLFAYYDFDEGTGTTLIDRVDGTMNLTIVNGNTWQTAGNSISGNATYFSGGYAKSGTNPAEMGTTNTDFSISFWARVYTDPNGYIWSRSYAVASSQEFSLLMKDYNDATWSPYFQVNNYDEQLSFSYGEYFGEGGIAEDEDEWHHYLFTYNSTDRRGTMYFDGETHNNTLQTGTLDNIYNGQVKAFTIASRNDEGSYAGSYYYTDEFALWNRTLGLSESEQLYNSGSGITYILNAYPPTINLNTPANNTISTSDTITFNCSADDNVEITNITFYLNGNVNYSETFTGTNDTSIQIDRTLSDANYNWTCVAYDDEDTQGMTDTWFLSVDAHTPTFSFEYPVDAGKYTETTTNITYEITELNSDTCYFNHTNTTTTTHYDLNCSDTNYTIDGSYGTNTYLLWANDTVGQSNSSSITFEIDNIYPTVSIEYPTNNTLYNYIIENFNTTIADDNLDTCWYSNDAGVTNTTFTCNTNISLSGTEGNNEWFVWANDTFGNENGTNVEFEIDTILPTYTLYSPVQNQNNITDTLPINIELNYSVEDANLDSCWYNTSDNATITSFICNTTQAVPFETEGRKTIWFYANDTLGQENSSSVDFNITYHTYTQNSNKDIVIEGNNILFNLTVNKTDIEVTTAKLLFNNTWYDPTTTTSSNNQYYFAKTISIPNNYGNTTGINYEWYWNYTISDIVSNYNTTKEEIKVYEFVIGNCTDYNTSLINLSIYDENTNAEMSLVNNSLLTETETNITSNGFSYMYSANWINQTNISICMPAYMINDSQSYILYFTASAEADNYATERFFYDGLTINESSLPLHVYLRDLELADSTSFLFTYKNENNILEKGLVVEVLRKYIGDGEYRIVEREITDSNGEVTLHLIEEDVIYKFKLYDNEVLIYTSLDYKAYCQTVPCAISLTKGLEEIGFDSDLDRVDGTYSFSSSAETREINVSFNLNNVETMNLSIYAYNTTDASLRHIDSESLTASSGVVTINVPYEEGNETFFAVLYKINDTGEYWVESKGIDFKDTLIERMGADGLFMVGLVLLSFGLISISSGAGAIIFMIIGLILIGFMAIIHIQTALIFIIIWGVLLVWKIMRGRTR